MRQVSRGKGSRWVSLQVPGRHTPTRVHTFGRQIPNLVWVLTAVSTN